jgi:hypothetical protein
MNLKISLFKSESPLLTKTIHDQGEYLEKDASSARMLHGECQSIDISPLELYQKLRAMNAVNSPKNLALGLGVTSESKALIVSRAHENKYTDSISRTKDHFDFADAPGYLLLDYDPQDGNTPLTVAEFRDRLIEAVPALVSCAMVVSYSTSSGIYHRTPSDNDFEDIQIINPLSGLMDLSPDPINEVIIARQQKAMSGIGGLHVYIPVSNARDIPRIVTVIYQRFWLKGHGYIKVSKSGAFLERSLVDASVASPERLVFESRPALDHTLFQLRRDPEFFEGDTLDVELILDLSTSELAVYASLVAEATEKVRPEAEAKGRIFLEQKVTDLVRSGLDRRAAEKVVKTATSGKSALLGCWTLTFSEFGTKRVADVLLDPETYHQAELLDPMDDPTSLRWRAKLYANADGSVLVHSFDNGGVVYRLTRRNLYLERGMIHQVMESLESILLETSEPCLYQRGGELVLLIENDQGMIGIYPADRHKLACLLSRLALALRKTEQGWVCTDVDMKYLDSFLNKSEWKLPRLSGVVTHPTLGPHGELVQAEGYDPRTGLYLDFGGFVFRSIPENPEKSDAERAFDYLRQIYKTFDFKTEVDFAVHLAALLTGLIRRSLQTAPMFLYTAPVPGSGKTLLASSISIVLTSGEPRMVAYTTDEDESRKRYLSILREGHEVVLIDNVNGVLAGDTLCTILTSPVFTDRVLGASKSVTVPTNTLILATGNNTAICGDLIRRVLVSELDPRCERPHERDFPDDFTVVSRQNRADIQAAGLTILHAYECAGRPGVGLPALGSFEEWSRRVRNAMVWVGIEDPVKSLAQNKGGNETLSCLGELLNAWHGYLGLQAVTAREVIMDCEKSFGYNADKDRLSAAISEVAFVRGNQLDGRTLGTYLRQNQGRIVGNLKFETCGEHQRAKKWRVVVVASNDPKAG